MSMPFTSGGKMSSCDLNKASWALEIRLLFQESGSPTESISPIHSAFLTRVIMSYPSSSSHFTPVQYFPCSKLFIRVWIGLNWGILLESPCNLSRHISENWRMSWNQRKIFWFENLSHCRKYMESSRKWMNYL